MPSSPSAPLDVLVVLVTYNSAEVLDGFLDTLPEACEGLTWHLCVADNASTDDSADTVSANIPEATVVRLDSNLGYAAGINAAVEAGPPSRAILVTNPDIRAPRGALRSMAEELHQLGAGIVSPRLVDDAGDLNLAMRREPSVSRTFSDAVLGGTRPRHWWPGEKVTERREYEQRQTCDWGTGAFMLIDRRCHEAVGGWDPRFFLYAEETDFALRARDAGWTWWYLPDPTVVHIGGESGVSPRLYTIMTVNKVRLVAKRSGRLRTLAYTAALVAFELSRCIGGDAAVHRAAATALLRPSQRPEEVRGGISGSHLT